MNNENTAIAEKREKLGLYLEGLMVYVEVAKNLVGEYLEKRN